jgi:hypothetical protein
MEIADLGVAAGQQLGIQLGRNRLELLGRDAVGRAVHAVAPAPEIVGRMGAGAAAFGQARHGALEGMAVRVDQAGQHRAGQTRGACRLLRRGAGLNALPAAVGGHRQQDVFGPCALHPGLGREKCLGVAAHGVSVFRRKGGRRRCSAPETIIFSKGCTCQASASS